MLLGIVVNVLCSQDPSSVGAQKKVFEGGGVLCITVSGRTAQNHV